MNDPFDSSPTDQAVAHNSLRQRAGLLIRKELRETLRDRRTIITLLAMPLMLYPLMGMVLRFIAVSQEKKTSGTVYTIVVGTSVEAEWLQSAINLGEQMMTRRALREAAAARQSVADRSARTSSLSGQSALQDSATAGGPATASTETARPAEPQSLPSLAIPGGTETASPATDDPRPTMRLMTVDSPDVARLEAAVSSLTADLAIQIEFGEPLAPSDPTRRADVKMISCRDSALSRDAQRFLEDRLQSANIMYLLSVARAVNPVIRPPARLTHEAIPTSQKSRGFLGLLPLVLLLMTVTGGVYPAIDLTAGERERDTLETLIALPIPRVHLLLAKFVAVFTVTLLTGLMNILAMTATVYTLRMDRQLFGDAGLTAKLAMSLVGIQIVFGLFYSALLLAITSSSRSFKEAQAYLIPLMLISIAPGLVILLPGWHLEGVVAVVPLINMLLLARDVFEGSAQILPATAAVISTLIYAASALVVAAQIFGTDAIAVGSRGTWSELFTRPAFQRTKPALLTGMITLAMLFPLYFFANGILSRLSGTDPRIRLLTSGGLTIALFGIFPLVVAWWSKLRLNTTWELLKPRSLVWPAVVALGLGTWPLIYELVLSTQQFGIAQITAERFEQVSSLLEKLRAVPVIITVLCLGFIPGIFEELFFRGFLLSSLRQSFRDWPAIMLCGTIFGVFHVIAAEGAALERLAPSTVLGCLLSWIAVRTGSVLPGIVLHVCHNSALLLIGHYRSEFSQIEAFGREQQHLPVLWQTGSAIVVVAGVIWIAISTRHRDLSAVSHRVA